MSGQMCSCKTADETGTTNGYTCSWHRDRHAIALAERDTRLTALVAALEEIAKGEGRFNLDSLVHCSNTVDDMKAMAIAALAAVRVDGGTGR